MWPSVASTWKPAIPSDATSSVSALSAYRSLPAPVVRSPSGSDPPIMLGSRQTHGLNVYGCITTSSICNDEQRSMDPYPSATKTCGTGRHDPHRGRVRLEHGYQDTTRA